MEACEIFVHKKFRGKVPGMETCEIFSHTKMKRNRFLECKLLR